MLNLLKSRIFLAGQGLVMLVVLVLVLGPMLGLTNVQKMAAILVIMFIGMIMLVVGYVRANRSASAIEKSIGKQADKQRQSVRPDNQAEIEQLQRDLEDAIERLKNSKLGGGRSGKSALYALPWYMIVGPPAAGKTTAIANSGLNFPIGMEGYRGVGGTRNCDWFFSDSAILLDTAGRYMTEQEDADEWNTFLQTLKENRKKQPVNGVIVAISIAELADATPEQIEWHASTIRRRIDDLVMGLDVTFPVYLLFTKCDLLRGFTQFFSTLNRKEREQILGCTLPKNWEEESDLGTLFEREFSRIADGLLNWRNERLGLSMKRSERNLVYVFPLEFATVKDKLSRFVSLLFRPNPYRDTPSFRGFYFTSGTQEGRPIDRVLASIARQFGLDRPSTEQAETETEAKAYFIRDVFEKVIIPDQYLVSQTSRAAKRVRLFKSGVGVAAVVLLGLFVLGATQAVVRSSTRIGQVEESARLVASVDVSDGLNEDDLASLEELRSQIDELEDPPAFGWGLDRGSTVSGPARTVLANKTRAIVGEHLVPVIHRRMEDRIREPFLDAGGKDSLELDAKAYLLLTDHVAQLDSSENAQFLNDHLNAVASTRRGLDDERVRPLMASFVNGLATGTVDPFNQDQRVVRDATRALSAPINATRLYNKLRRDSEEESGDLTLTQIVSDGATYFTSNPSIPNFFTQDEWRESVRQKISEYSAAPRRDAWVPWAQDAPEVDKEEFETRLTELYLEDYAEEWEEFLGGVRLESFDNMRDAVRTLEVLAHMDDSPILRLLYYVSRETTFDSFGENLADNVTGADSGPRNVVERRFQGLRSTFGEGIQSGDVSENLMRALNGLRNTLDDLDPLIGNDAEAAAYARRVVNRESGTLVDYRQEVDNAMQTQLSVVGNNLFEAPVLLAWDTVLGAAQSYMNERWTTEVYEPYQSTLLGKYPLGNGDDALVRDFETFFRPNDGTIDEFVSAELSGFLQDERTEPRRWQNRGLVVSTAVQRSLENISRLQDVFFDPRTGGFGWTFTLEPEWPLDANGVQTAGRSYFLNIHGTTQEYTMGTAFPTTFEWPGTDPGVRLDVKMLDSDLPTMSYDGRWALFRFLSDAQLTSRGGSEYTIMWNVDRGIRAVYLARVQRSVNPLSEPDLFDVAIPARLGN